MRQKDSSCVDEETPSHKNWKLITLEEFVSLQRGHDLPDFKGNDENFVYYFLKSIDFAGFNSGCAQPSLNRNYIYPIPVRIPPLPQQRAIAHILGSLDDKIEANRRMNETLEAMARAIFNSWFVDFDPVRAKAAGLEPAGMDAETAAMFPDSFEETELEMVPKGWKVGSVDEEFHVTMGQSPPGETYNEVGAGMPFYQGCADFMFRFPIRRVYCTTPARFAKAEDTLISVRAPVGDINMAVEDCAIGRGVAPMRHKSGGRSYTYYSVRSLDDAFARFDAEGTVFGSIGKKDFHNLACVVPSMEVVKAFERLVGPIDDKIALSERQSRTLAALRDMLLPMLLSGEIRAGSQKWGVS